MGVGRRERQQMVFLKVLEETVEVGECLPTAGKVRALYAKRSVTREGQIGERQTKD